MRRVVMCAALLLVMGVATPVRAGDVINSSGSQEEISADWFVDTGGGGLLHGRALGTKVKGGGSFVDFFEIAITPITCDNGTPEPEDDFPGSHVEVWVGAAPGTVVIDKQYRTGSASAVMDLIFDSFDDCFFFPFSSPGPNNGGGGTVIANVPVDIAVTATSALVRSTSSDRFHIPSEVNSSFRFDTRQREGTGVVHWGANERQAFLGLLGKISWRGHSNS